MQVRIFGDKKVDSVPDDQTLEHELQIGQFAFLHGPLYSVYVDFPIMLNIMRSEN